ILAAATDGRGLWEFNSGGSGATSALAINDASASRPASGTAPLTFTVTSSQASSSTVTVNYATHDASAIAGVDDIATSGALTCPANSTTSKTITVQVIGSNDNSTKDFFVNLSSPTNATLTKGQGKGTIKGGATGQPALSINDVTSARPVAGAMAPFTFTVSL